jgi:Na+-transporting methylmalonyl-CoA/oxaloacetate decarboxylase gamma subunit
MEIVFFLILLLAVLFGISYAIFSFFTAPGTVEKPTGSPGSKQNEGQFFDGADGYDATGGYQESRD